MDEAAFMSSVIKIPWYPREIFLTWFFYDRPQRRKQVKLSGRPQKGRTT